MPRKKQSKVDPTMVQIQNNQPTIRYVDTQRNPKDGPTFTLRIVDNYISSQEDDL